MIIYQVRGEFHGVYEWGQGFVSPTVYRKWHNFWRNDMKAIFWKNVNMDNSVGSSDYLVSLNGSVYLHPMNFTAFLSGNEPNSLGQTDDSWLKELYKVCQQAAEACGGSFKMYVRLIDKVEGLPNVEYKVESNAA